MRTPLHFDRVAPGGVTLPFLLAAPFFGLFAAVLLVVAGDGVLLSRWHPALIGALHLYTIGFLLFSIAGALLQIGPVITARLALQNERVAARIRFALGTGAVLLGCGLFHNLRVLLVPAVILFAIALPAWLWLAIRGIGGSKTNLLIALAGFAIGLSLGLRLAAGHAFPAIGLPRQLTDLHAGWMLLAGIAPLVMAIGVIVIPMFQHTNPLPRVTRFLPVLCVAGMLLQSIPGTGNAGAFIAAGALVAFACIVLAAHAARRSTARDATVQLFQLAMFAAIAAVLAGVCAMFFTQWQHRLQWMAGALMIAGFAGSSVHGMALKIVPFLVRLRLQRLLWQNGRQAVTLPGFQQLLPVNRARLLPPLQALSVVFLAFAAASAAPWAFFIAAILLGVTQLASAALLLVAVANGLRAGAALADDADNNSLLKESAT